MTNVTTSPGRTAATELPATMIAVLQTRYGTHAGEVLRTGQIAVPAVGPREVLVRVHAAAVDRGTWHLMAGEPYMIRPMLGMRGPRRPVPGRDVAGTVVACGGRVTTFTVGDEVFGIAPGSLAEFAVAPAAKLARRPVNVAFAQAAAVPISGLTALQALRDKARLRPGQHVLVLGASGGVGSFTVQIAKAIGAEVTGVCSAAKAGFVRDLGADHVIEYGPTDVAGTGRYDVIVDIAGRRPLRQLRRMLTPRGALVLVGSEGGGRLTGGIISRNTRATIMSPFVRQRLTALISREVAADLDALRELIEAGSVTPVVDRVVPLGEAAAAIDALSSGSISGKAVVEVVGASPV